MISLVFDVYVVGAIEAGEDGLDKLAEAMSARYGLPVEDLRARLVRGRFRVKANVDRATGEAYQKDLASIGGKCILEAAGAAPASASIPPPMGQPGIAVARTTTPPAIAVARTSTPPAGVYQSGLSAAFTATAEAPATDLGALGRADAFSLASLDGHDNEALAAPVAAASFAPPGGASAPAPAAGKPGAKPPRPRDEPVELDPFRPPDAEEAERPVEIAADELEHRARRRVSVPPATEAAPPTAASSSSLPAMRRSTPSMAPATAPVARPPEAVAIVRPKGRLGYLGDEGVRFAVGVVLAIVIGFVPAHVVAGVRERSVDRDVDAVVEQHQAAVTGQEDYDALDAFRARQLDDKRSAHRSILLMALAIWAAAGGGLAFGWFKKVPWDDLDQPR